MAKKIHPKMNLVKFKFANGSSLELPSTYNRSEYLCDNDIFVHSAWKEDNASAINTGSAIVNKFNNMFGSTTILQSVKTAGSYNLKEEK